MRKRAARGGGGFFALIRNIREHVHVVIVVRARRGRQRGAHLLVECQRWKEERERYRMGDIVRDIMATRAEGYGHLIAGRGE